MTRLSARLQFLFDLCLPEKPLWDFCCDHGLLGLRALESEQFPEVHFVDQALHLIARLKEEIEDPSRAFFHAMDARDLHQPLFGSVVIAGVGADLTLSILRALEEKNLLEGLDRMIFCPQKDESTFAQNFRFLKNWNLKEVGSVQEGPRLRQVWVADRAAPAVGFSTASPK